MQLAHLLLSPSVDVRAVVGSHLRAGDPFDLSGRSAAHAADAARTIAELCARDDVTVIAGSESGLTSRSAPAESAATRAIVAEALRDDTSLPLFVTCGGGLTEIASAWLLDPRIAERLTVVWIGGHEHPGMADPPPGGTDLEYNTATDPVAAQAARCGCSSISTPG